jgi:FixJ family two-component response regulator
VEKPDCLVVDVRLPGMNGFQVQERMVHERLNIPLIFMTAHADERAEQDVAPAASVGFLGKPFAGSTLIELIERALHRSDRNGHGSSGRG